MMHRDKVIVDDIDVSEYFIETIKRDEIRSTNDANVL